MNDDNWETINGPIAHQMEALNAASTINLLECIVLFATAAGANNIPNHIALKELHRSGTIFLLQKPGDYRDCPVVVANKMTGVVIHNPPPHPDVPGLMDEFFKELFELNKTGDALDLAAFSLWKINWIHPFKNGNGRTARAFAYACLCAKLGSVLPGSPTVIDQIMMTRAEYEACIREGDASFAAGNLNLSRMKLYLDGLLQIQIQSAQQFSA